MRWIVTLALASLFGGAATVSAQVPDACTQGNDWPARIQACTTAIDGGGLAAADQAVAYDARCRARIGLQQFEQAIGDCDQAIALNPELASAYNNRGAAHGNLGNHQQAVADFDAMVRLEPNNANAVNNRAVAQNQAAWALYVGGDAAGGLPLVDQALAVAPNAANFLDTRGHINAALGNADAALADFEAAMRAGGAQFTRQYQQALANYGYDPGPVDGAYGNRTRTALTECLQAGCRLLE
ncbi:MAG: tetratricopeptide repeat protein [Alphaproteobacteria bacterium]